MHWLIFGPPSRLEKRIIISVRSFIMLTLHAYNQMSVSIEVQLRQLNTGRDSVRVVRYLERSFEGGEFSGG